MAEAQEDGLRALVEPVVLAADEYHGRSHRGVVECCEEYRAAVEATTLTALRRAQAEMPCYYEWKDEAETCVQWNKRGAGTVWCPSCAARVAVEAANGG